MTNRELGRIGEDMAENYLKSNGFQILNRNYRCRAGEIDIVALKGSTLHFIEVKTRQSDVFGHPAEAITPKKIGRMRAASRYYLSSIENRGRRFRQIQFDALEVEINYIANI